MRPLLVGEANPYSSEERLALAPLPRGAAGDRLRRILGMTVREYLRAFERVNLCRRVWDDDYASWAAGEVVHSAQRRGQPVILLGARVAKAVGVPYLPFRRQLNTLVLPHPSGRCRTWNDRENWTRARRAVSALLKEGR